MEERYIDNLGDDYSDDDEEYVDEEYGDEEYSDDEEYDDIEEDDEESADNGESGESSSVLTDNKPRNKAEESLSEVLQHAKHFNLSEDDANFLERLCLEAYNNKFDNDKFVPDGVSRLFGFRELADVLRAYFEETSNPNDSVDAVMHRVENNLIAKLRSDVGIEDYISKNLIEEDKKLLSLLEHKQTESSDERSIRQIIKDNHVCNTLISQISETIDIIYRYVFQDGYGLSPYEGVVVLNTKKQYSMKVIHDGDTYGFGAIENAASVFGSISKVLSSKLGVSVSFDRQFDVEAIVKSEKPIYYPKKIIEYASGLEVSKNTNKDVYKKHASNKFWDAVKRKDANGTEQVVDSGYYAAHIKPEIKNLVIKTIAYAILEELNSRNMGKTAQAVDSLLSDTSVSDKIKMYLRRLQNSVCTAVVITEYNDLGNKTNKISLRVVNTTSVSGLPRITRELFGSLVLSDYVNFSDGYVLSDDIHSSAPPAYEIVDFSHDFDEALSNAEPLFGYKAVELYNEREMEMSWNKILLGKSTKGSDLFASITDSEDIGLQNCLTHNMMAGSRSGKGVMTMNIMASAIASNRNIFYIDRKPDMASMFYEITQGSMFIVNGGQNLTKNDPYGYFGSNGVANSGWDEAYDRMPEYLKESLFTNRKYEDDFGDYVYYRAIIFVIGIIIARVEVAEEKANLGGEEGIIAIIDEFKNWQLNFEAKFMELTGKFCKNENRLTSTAKKSYKSNLIKLKQLQNKLEIARNDEKKADKVPEYEMNIENLKEQLHSDVNELKLYCTTVMDKYGESVSQITSVLSSGFNEETKHNDVFIIGQTLEKRGYFNSSTAYPTNKDGSYQSNEETKQKSLLRGLFNNLGKIDWFMGYNVETAESREYMGCGDANSPSHRWITERRYWAYCSDTSMDTIMKSAPSNTVYFKPYLVLNNSLEDDPSNHNDDYEHSFVRQCRDRVNDAVPGKELWEEVRKKHLTNLPKEQYAEVISNTNKHYGELNEGIGFEGLIHTMNPSIDLKSALSGSGTIANYVAGKMGYSSYTELLFDFSPKGLFSVRDIINALKGSDAYFDLNKRLPLFAEFGFIDGGSADGDELDGEDEYYGEEDGNGGDYDLDGFADMLGDGEPAQQTVQNDTVSDNNNFVQQNENTGRGMPSGQQMNNGSLNLINRNHGASMNGFENIASVPQGNMVGVPQGNMGSVPQGGMTQGGFINNQANTPNMQARPVNTQPVQNKMSMTEFIKVVYNIARQYGIDLNDEEKFTVILNECEEQCRDLIA